MRFRLAFVFGLCRCRMLPNISRLKRPYVNRGVPKTGPDFDMGCAA